MACHPTEAIGKLVDRTISTQEEGYGLPYHRTVSLLRTIGSPFVPNNNVMHMDYSEDIYMVAHENKIPLAYLDALVLSGKNQPPRYDHYIRRVWEKVHVIAEMSDLFTQNHIDYAILQLLEFQSNSQSNTDIGNLGVLLRDPDDIDIRIMGSAEEFRRAIRILADAGYELSGSAPNQQIFNSSEGVVLDIKYENSVSHLIYVDKLKMDYYLETISLPRGVETKALNPEAHLLIILADAAIGKNQYKLADYYFTLHCMAQMDEQRVHEFVVLVNKNCLRDAARWYLTLTLLLHTMAHQTMPDQIVQALSMTGTPCSKAYKTVISREPPYPCGIKTLSKILSEKLRDGSFRRSLLRQIPRTLSPTFADRLLDRARWLLGGDRTYRQPE